MNTDVPQPAEAAKPRHIAIIMDGNGRWAKARGLPRLKGHEQGAESVIAVLRACKEMDIGYLTLYAFSSENWSRPTSEVSGLMQLLRTMLRLREKDLHENQVRLRVIGRLAGLPADLRAGLERAMHDTAGYQRQLVLALNYGGRAELADAMTAIAQKVKRGVLEPESITEQTVSDHLYAPDLPDPDLLIRTSGEIRLSNFLLWQLSYAEFYFTPVLWPDFREAQLREAVAEFSRRKRKFGGLDGKGS